MSPLEAFAWDHFGDQYDRILEIRATFKQWLRDTACWWLGHRLRWDISPWDWDGEGYTYCERCECDNPGSFTRNPCNTLPDFLETLWFEIRVKLRLTEDLFE